MVQSNVIEEVAALFMETGQNHHKAFKETDGVDPEWPLWYADYLHSKLGKLLKAELTKSEIIYLLLTLEKKRTAEAPDSHWTEYYAKILANKYITNNGE